MTAQTKPTSDVQQLKLDELSREKRRAVLLNSAFGAGIFFVSAVFVMLVSGNYFSGILGFFGLEGFSNSAIGVYADCSKRENRNIRYCQGNRDRNAGTLRTLGESKGKGGTIFSLGEP